VALPYVIPAQDRVAFMGCRRAWDFGARERRNRELVRPEHAAELERTLRDTLAVYYFPGMWDWQTSIVLPLVRKALTDSVAEQRAEYLDGHGRSTLPVEQEQAVAECLETAAAMLEAFIAWAPTVDDFTPVQVVAEVDVQVPDHRSPGRDLVAPGGRPVHYRDRIDVLVTDEESRYWVLQHRLVHGPWPDLDALRLAERGLSWCWAWEQANPGLRVHGTIYNELSVGRPEASPPPPGPRGMVRQHRSAEIRPWFLVQGGPPDPEFDLRIRPAEQFFRRVQVPRTRTELAAFGDRLADQLTDMIDSATRIYPNPAPHRCGQCIFRAPCLATELGNDAEALLATSYRDREHEPKPGTLGATTWSLGRGAAAPPSSPRRDAASDQ